MFNICLRVFTNKSLLNKYIINERCFIFAFNKGIELYFLYKKNKTKTRMDLTKLEISLKNSSYKIIFSLRRAQCFSGGALMSDFQPLLPVLYILH